MMRVIVSDDEELARDHLQQVLTDETGVNVVAACRDGYETREAIDHCRPDAVFLDIEMPGATGIELARGISGDGPPLVVLVSAYSHYAVEAFDLYPVVDYLLKPAEPVRCRRAVSRLSRVLRTRVGGGEPAQTYLTRVFVREGDRLVHLPIDEVETIETLGNYVKLHARNRSFVVRGTLTSLESRLNPRIFLRTHRSCLVNVRRVRELVSNSHSDGQVLMEGGRAAPLSRVYRERLNLFVLNAGSGEM